MHFGKTARKQKNGGVFVRIGENRYLCARFVHPRAGKQALRVMAN